MELDWRQALPAADDSTLAPAPSRSPDGEPPVTDHDSALRRIVESLPRSMLESLVLCSLQRGAPITPDLVRNWPRADVKLGKCGLETERGYLDSPDGSLGDSFSDTTSIADTLAPPQPPHLPASTTLTSLSSPLRRRLKDLKPLELDCPRTSAPLPQLSPILPSSLLPALPPGPCMMLVGAGPGDPSLLTLAAYGAIMGAEAVVCDGLEIRRLIPAHVPFHIASKTCGKQAAVQADLNSISLHHLTLSRRVVRLKGGDPFVFGRGLEEALLYTRGNPSPGAPNHDPAYPPFDPVPVFVLPGVSSALAGPAAAGIPVTHRGVARDVCVVTAKIEHGTHGLPNAVMPGYAAGGRTVVVMMGVKEIQAVVRGFVKHSLEPWPVDTPVALVEKATTPNQRVLRGTLGDIADVVTRSSPIVTNQSVIVVGGVVEKSWELRRGVERGETDLGGVVDWASGMVSMTPRRNIRKD
ncbi:tetrapyrrole methylase [Gonapodya prolifera JEL478]|uniref:Tetrapyrrole methylase n=1 Tax=Gonapodya prolifera (strain JEL478) TaxID=1344416 RepID=A0A139ACY8_GONPJ|nr:tetrapyrrole methylase [Gonapodya prolifera JEL478]|eukprot:KXS14630.1 tetrapyrrole methylase [Gonapodya prolifera JEL478]